MAVYDAIGQGYSAHRRPDTRIAERIHRALGDARAVLNVGAGTGNYEPRDRAVVALDPSVVMLSAHPGRLRVQGEAERLPFRDGAFDAAMAIATVHHWREPRRGLAELRRVARRQVVFAFDTGAMRDFWLTRDYFPEICVQATDEFGPDAIAVELGARVEPVPLPHDCTDGFMAAWWRRPERYLDPAVRAGMSVFAREPESRWAAGLERLRADLASGRWAERNAELLDRDECDIGCRLLVAGD